MYELFLYDEKFAEGLNHPSNRYNFDRSGIKF